MPRYLILTMPLPSDPAATHVAALTPETTKSGPEVLQAWADEHPPQTSQRLFALDISGAVVYDVDVQPQPPSRVPRAVPALEAASSLPAFDPEASSRGR